MVLGKLGIYIQKYEDGSLQCIYKLTQDDWRPKHQRQSIILSEESIQEKLHGTWFGYDFLDIIPKHRQQKIKIDNYKILITKEHHQQSEKAIHWMG